MSPGPPALLLEANSHASLRGQGTHMAEQATGQLPRQSWGSPDPGHKGPRHFPISQPAEVSRGKQRVSAHLSWRRGAQEHGRDTGDDALTMLPPPFWEVSYLQSRLLGVCKLFLEEP